ncbi:MAG TPA: hypothetical protein VE078_11415, partial [Thermoanaerobaculia bacterium]|nr:hypothetical protein [Thermoanaerobaculia bacterium]
MHGVTVRNGQAVLGPEDTGHGGGIRAGDGLRLKLVRSVVTANQTSQDGGGISAVALEVLDSTISGNTAGGSGGGILVWVPDMRNVTISGNHAAVEGGGLFYYTGSAALEHLTITGNNASLGGGVAAASPPGCICEGPYVMNRTVIAGNTAAIRPDCNGVFYFSAGHNAFGVGDGCGAQATDLAGTLAQPLDPRLGPLGSHGGPTPTHVPLEDQRGRPRPDQALCDTGAVERLSACQPDEETLCLWAPVTASGSPSAGRRRG